MTNSQLQRFYESAAADLDDYGELSVRGMLARGFDISNGFLAHNGVPIGPSYLAPNGGRVPTSVEANIERERAVLTSNYSRAWHKHFALAMRPGLGGGGEAAVDSLSQTERNALFEGSSSAGGFTVPPETASTILSRMQALSVVRARATVIPTISDELNLPALSAHATSASVYGSDWEAAWAPETPSTDSTDPSFEMFTIAVKKARTGVLRLSRNLADDAPSALGHIIDVGARDLSLKVDGGFIAGTGASHQPRGLLESGVTEIDIEGSTSNTISNTTSNAGSATKIATLVENLPAQYRRNGVMIASTTGEAALMKLVDADGGRTYRRGQPCEGLRLEVSPHLEADGADGNRPVLVGDLSQFIVAQRSLAIHILRERYADVDQVGAILIERVGGGLWNTQAVRIGVV